MIEIPQHKLRPLIAPTSVAVVGATERPVHGGTATRNLLAANFDGPVYLVNPKYETLFDLPCYPSLESLPEVPECVVIGVGAQLAVEQFELAGELGCKAAVMVASGFAEAGPEGALLQRRLADAAERYGIPLCGPNCLGVFNITAGLPLYSGYVAKSATPGHVGIVAQSGSVAHVVSASERVDCSILISCGNQVGTTVDAYLDYLLDDPATRAIALHLESVGRGDELVRLFELARERKKPIVVLKPGRSERAARAAVAHTGAFAGSDAVFDAVCAQTGVIRVDDLDELVEVLALLSRLDRIPESGGLGMLTCSGGENAIALDVAHQLTLDMPVLADSTLDALRSVLPEFATPSNPVDVTGMLMFETDRYRKALRLLADDDQVGMVLVAQDVLRATTEEQADDISVVATLELAASHPKPVAFLTNVSGDVSPLVTSRMAAANVPLLEGTRKGMNAVRRVLDWSGRLRHEPSAELPGLDPDALAALGARLRDVPEPLVEAEAKALLGALGFPVPRGRVASGADDALAAAEEIGYPVVLKVSSPDIQHKSDVGGIRVGIASPEQLRRAHDELLTEVGRRAPDADIRGVLVEESVAAGGEAIVGMHRDPAFGPVVAVGFGGVFAEIVHQAQLRLPPIGAADARGMIAALPAAEIWRGARGSRPLDVAALADLVARFSALCVATRGLVDAIDLNPVLLLPEGEGVRVADALVVAASSEEA